MGKVFIVLALIAVHVVASLGAEIINEGDVGAAARDAKPKRYLFSNPNNLYSNYGLEYGNPGYYGGVRGGNFGGIPYNSYNSLGYGTGHAGGYSGYNSGYHQTNYGGLGYRRGYPGGYFGGLGGGYNGGFV